MKKLLSAATLAAATLLGASAMAADKPSEVQIGITAFLSGPASVFGEPAKAAAEMIIEDMNANGGIGGVPVKAHFVDEGAGGEALLAEYRRLVQDVKVDAMFASISSGTYSSLLNDAVSQVSSILAGDFSRRGLDPDLAPLYAQALVGSVSMTAQWWLDTREPKKEVVAAHLVNLMWNGLTHLEADPQLQDE